MNDMRSLGVLPVGDTAMAIVCTELHLQRRSVNWRLKCSTVRDKGTT
jgi:hypothetical protein